MRGIQPCGRNLGGSEGLVRNPWTHLTYFLCTCEDVLELRYPGR